MSRTSQDRLNESIGGAQINITGLRETLRALEKAGADTQDMKDLMHGIGEIVASKARRNTPVKSGKLAGSIRAGKGKTKAVVRAGGARIPYAGVIEYGWPAHNIESHLMLTDALGSSHTEVLAALSLGIDQILKQNKLK